MRCRHCKGELIHHYASAYQCDNCGRIFDMFEEESFEDLKTQVEREKSRVMKMLKVFEAFAGYGSQRMALENIGAPHEVVAISEIDKFAIKSYEAIHGETINLGDITEIKVEDVPDHDLFTYSFPCQDISTAGKQAGFDRNAGTRSGLLWECERIISSKKPKYLLMENVKNLVGKKFMGGFQEWIDYLESVGYSNYWQVLNAKDYGIPQHRERVFMVSILGEHKPYQFPEPIKLEKRLKDVLEPEVDEKYYLKREQSDALLAGMNVEHTTDEPVITASRGRNINKTSDRTPGVELEQRLEVNKHGVSNSLTTVQKDNYVVEPTTYGVSMNRNEINSEIEIAHTLLARDYKGFGNQNMNGVIESERILGIFDKENSTHQAGSVYNKDKISPTLDTMQGGWRQPSVVDGYRVRRLTPLECWRLMGVKDELFYKAQEVNSNSQLYKQAGNSIVVNVLEGIFRNMV